MIKAYRSGDALVADIAAADPSGDLLHIWWLGQSGFVIAHQGRRLVLDPYLSDSLTIKYAGTRTPHIRMSERTLEPDRLDFVDIVTASHHHSDHLDSATLRPILRASPNARLVAPRAHRDLVLERTGIERGRLLEIDHGVEVEVAGFRLLGVPAAHEQLERDEQGRMRFLGYVITAGPFRVYHAGDTVPYDGMAGHIGAVDVALLPINGRDAQRGVPGNLDAKEAAALAAELPAAAAVPCHYNMFAFNTAAPELFVTECGQRGVAATVLRAGERLTRLSADRR